MPLPKNGILSRLLAYRERRRLLRSHGAPFIAGSGRDSFRFYQDGRSVEIHAELILGKVERRIFPQALKWSDNQEELMPAKHDEVIQNLCEYFDRKGVTWEVFDGDPQRIWSLRASHSPDPDPTSRDG
ncbi:MAG TPA: hypothetical protein VHD32_04270 [Candidatus Didemnitutus sp.]|nr:hypothetical protein [Candidatus Didemnitutus sp.]